MGAFVFLRDFCSDPPQSRIAELTHLSQPTLLFHDYETWGANPQKDPACQFAAIRTDLDLNIVDKPINLFCQIPNDYLPHPQACLVTGITPQHSLRDGMIEAEFVAKVHEQLARPQTCVLGYNSIRFDDEVTRYALYRNFYDPYAREWQNGNSRWDVIDVVRACYALRPEGIEWAYKEDGSPSFRLEDLSRANQIEHEDAHDALADVYATIAMAKLVKTAQPKLYSFLFNLRSKREVLKQIDCFNMQPFVHVSSKLPAINGCCTWMVPIAPHPSNKNAIIALNLAMDPTPLFEHDAETLREKLYTPTHMLEEGESRLPIKLIHINKCPVIAPAKTLTEADAERLGIDRKGCLHNLNTIRSHRGLAAKLQEIYEVERDEREVDADHALYTGGFFSDHDKAQMAQIRSASEKQLASHNWSFEDPRIKSLLFRYRARNYPASLDEDEMLRWQRHRHYRLTDPASEASLHLPQFIQELEILSQQHAQDSNKLAILQALYQYAENL